MAALNRLEVCAIFKKYTQNGRFTHKNVSDQGIVAIVEIKDMLEMFYPNIILESFGPGTRRSLVGPHDERIIFG